MELSIWGGFFAGEDYNFLIFGQKNSSESSSVEVIRLVKYSKDWQRLGQASLKGANTTVPFDAGSLRCDEYGGTGKSTGRSWSVQLTDTVGVTTPVLVPTGPDGGCVLWNGKSGYTANDKEGNLWATSDFVPNSMNASENTPVKVMEGVRQVTVGRGDYVLAVKEDNTLWGWGDMYLGSITPLIPDFDSGSDTPIKIMDQVASVDIHSFGVMAVKTDGSLWYLGQNSGDDGSGTTSGGAVTAHHVMDNVEMVARGNARYLALKTGGTVWAWGADGYSGDDKFISYQGDNPQPLTKLALPADVISIGMDGEVGWAIASTGALWTWGNNDYGEVGNGMAYGFTDSWTSSKAQLQPVKIIEKDVISADLGCAVLKNGDYYMWGPVDEGGDATNRYGESIQSVPKLTDTGRAVADSLVRKDGSVWTPESIYSSAPAAKVVDLFTPITQSEIQQPTNPFTDVPNDAYYTDAVAWADSTGLLSDTGKAFTPGAQSPGRIS